MNEVFYEDNKIIIKAKKNLRGRYCFTIYRKFNGKQYYKCATNKEWIKNYLNENYEFIIENKCIKNKVILEVF